MILKLSHEKIGKSKATIEIKLTKVFDLFILGTQNWGNKMCQFLIASLNELIQAMKLFFYPKTVNSSVI